MIRILALRNRQRTRALHTPLLRRLVRHLLKMELGVEDYQLCFHFVGSKEMAAVNWQFLQRQGSTDVITFDNHATDAPATRPPGLNGEIFICTDDAVKQARAFDTTWQEEVARYIIHGLLHLAGYDDLEPTKRRLMKREENRLMKSAAEEFTLRHLGRNSKLKTPGRS